MTIREKLLILLTEPRTMDELVSLTGNARVAITQELSNLRKSVGIEKKITYKLRNTDTCSTKQK